MAADVLLVSLPAEVICNILIHVPVQYHPAVSLTCRYMRDCSYIDSLWLSRCREYNIDDYRHWQGVSSYYQLFTKILYKYGSLLGVWFRQMDCYGGLVTVEAWKGGILGEEYIIKQRADGFIGEFDVVHRPLFEITTTIMDNDRTTGCIVKCRTLPDECHRSELDVEMIHNGIIDIFRLICKEKSRHGLLGNMNRLILADVLYRKWVRDEVPDHLVNNALVSDLVLRKYRTYLVFSHKFSFKRLSPSCDQVSIQGCRLQTGFYVGTYGLHGLEIVHVEIKNQTVIAFKITGDPNIPAGKETVKGFLDNPVIICGSEHNPFAVPSDLIVPSDNHIPDHLTAIFYGSGQVAYHGWRLPRFVNGKFVVFNCNTFGFVWLDNIRSFSLFKRLNDGLLY